MRNTQILTTVNRSVTSSPPELASPGWDQLVCSAATRLNEGWVLPETRCHPAVAEELAAFLCAYTA